MTIGIHIDNYDPTLNNSNITMFTKVGKVKQLPGFLLIIKSLFFKPNDYFNLVPTLQKHFI